MMPRDAKAIVIGATNEIKDRIGRATQNIVEIGTRLNVVKQHLPHGAFGDWLDAEFGWNERTAQRMMGVATTFKSDTVSDLNIGAKALYLLASPSTPDEVRSEIVTRAQSGEAIKHKDVRAAVSRTKPSQSSAPARNSEPGPTASETPQPCAGRHCPPLGGRRRGRGSA
ncbi:MAG: DUF3102 domain-containing protein [Tepidisphaeraceae bacterium]